MSARAGIEQARRDAQGIIAAYGATAPHDLVVEEIAAWLGVSVAEAPLDGALGQLINPRWGRPWILVSDRCVAPALRRFTIAHELGHYVRGHRSPPLAELCGQETRTLVRGELAPEEVEANAFAAELLMPEALAGGECIGAAPRLDTAARIAEVFGVSLPAAAIRFTELTDAACAAVLSERGVVLWSAPSTTFGRWIRPGLPLDPRSAAAACAANPSVSAPPQPVPTAAWFAEGLAGALVEHSWALPDRGTVLTLLSVTTPGVAAFAAAAPRAAREPPDGPV